MKDKKPIDVSVLVALAQETRRVTGKERLPPGPWTGLDPFRIVYRGDGNDATIAVYGNREETGAISDLILHAREHMAPLADGILALAREVTMLRNSLAVAAGSMMDMADDLEQHDGDIDGKWDQAREIAIAWRQAAGVADGVPPLALYRFKDGDIHIARTTAQAAKSFNLCNGRGQATESDFAPVLEDPLTLSSTGFASARARASYEPMPEDVPLTKTLAEWLEGAGAGQFWVHVG